MLFSYGGFTIQSPLHEQSSLFPLFLNPFFDANYLHFLKSTYFLGVKDVGVFAFFAPVCFAWEFLAFTTEIKTFLDATLADWTVAPAPNYATFL